jgi:hypothetical protein
VADALELISDEVKVEVLDVFQSSLGILNDVLKKAYLGLTRFAPKRLERDLFDAGQFQGSLESNCWPSAI